MDLDTIQNIGLPTFAYRSGGRSSSGLGRVITDLLPYLFGVAGIILILTIISSGYQMMMSKGDPKAMQVAQGRLTTSVVGILILFSSFFILPLILR